MVDGMVENMGVEELWDREGGNGQYPPPSLHVSYGLLACKITSGGLITVSL